MTGYSFAIVCSSALYSLSDNSTRQKAYPYEEGNG